MVYAASQSSTAKNNRSRLPTFILDCDPGIDDTFALFYLSALHHAGEINLVAVTTTAGNTTVENTARNAAWVLAQCAPQNNAAHNYNSAPAIPVAMGHPRPLQVPLETTPETHGPTGLGYATSTWPGSADEADNDDADAVDLHTPWQQAWSAALDAHDDVHLIVTGPATNAAVFAQENPELFARFSAITVMGGSVNYPGNTTPTAEWNFWVDPHAAQYLFEATTVPITLCSLEVTEQMLLTPARLRELQRVISDAAWATQLEEISRFYFEFHDSVDEGYQAQIHDLLTAMIAVGTVDTISQATRITVEADSALLRGTSIADLKNHWKKPPNARLIQHADIRGAFAELDRAARLYRAPGYLG